MTPTDIDALLKETEATLLSISPTTTEEIQELEDDLKSLVVFQQECERRLDDLTGEREAVREGPDGETVEGMAQDEEERAGGEERRGGPEENSPGRSRRGSKDEVRETEVDTGGRKEGEAQGKENQGEGETKGKVDIKEDMEKEEKEEEEEEEEEMKLAQRSLLEAANDLTELRPQRSEGRSVRPKSKLSPRKSSDSPKSNSPASDPFGNGQPVTEKPRPLLSPKNSPVFTMSNLQQELTYFLDMSFQSPKKIENYFTFPEVPNNSPATSSRATTPTASDVTTTPTTTPPADNTRTKPISPTTPTTTNTNTFSPPTSPLHHPHKTPEAMSSFSSTSTINTINTTPPFTPPPLSSTSTTSCAFIYPSSPRTSIPASPRSEKGFFQHDQPQQHQEQHQHHKKPRHLSFSSLVEEIKIKGWRNSFRITNKKRRLVISEPQDFRQLKATTTIRPDMDTFMPDAINLRRTGNGTTEV